MVNKDSKRELIDREEHMGLKGAVRRERVRVSPELERLCDDYLKQSASFAQNFVKLAGLPEQKAPRVEHTILGECAEVITRARITLLRQ